MSFVMVIATSTEAVLTGDYRRTHIENDEVYHDDTPKAFHLTKNVLGGFTGDVSVMWHLRNTVKLNPQTKIKSVGKAFEEALKNNKNAYFTMILVGKDEKGRMQIAEITHTNNFKAKYIKVKPGQVKWFYSFAYVNPGALLQEAFEEAEEINYTALEKMATYVNNQIAKGDVRVSEKFDLIRLDSWS